ncbi:MAG: hypothetical protein P0Y53_05650 [Candidatus Pseudobacter hemicellulosilyticus]|uniref:Uncharacterized protein n=1 Tax=Candidatus Pseudobacter hemicellulosilyticus TaxID=3121375 RepID=A0AAJ6BJ53_9BACT|nr:MAG: hypothetical protein P0Y53_05650 [Pseudobacter sp.]
MKPVVYPFLIAGILAVSGNLSAQSGAGVDSTGLPGDQFSLQGALELFRKAESPEAFEKLLNSKDNSVNNLDLNEDGQVDYISVIDRAGTNTHAFVLQVAVSASEKQDIAVIELEKTGPETAMVQIVGDEDLYGEQVIVEPRSEEADQTYADPRLVRPRGPAMEEAAAPEAIVVNVWFWPGVRFVYAPVYAAWVSPWRWHYYPTWYRPWRPLAWHVVRPRVIVYQRPFVVVHTHRVMAAHRVYTPVRVYSTSVRTRNAVVVNNYRVTRTKTTVTGPRGHAVTKTSTTVRGKNGHVKAKHTRVRSRH